MSKEAVEQIRKISDSELRLKKPATWNKLKRSVDSAASGDSVASDTDCNKKETQPSTHKSTDEQEDPIFEIDFNQYRRSILFVASSHMININDPEIDVLQKWIALLIWAERNCDPASTCDNLSLR